MKNQDNYVIKISCQKQKTSLADIFKRLRLKVASKKMINLTNSKMLQSLQPIQHYLINDQSYVVTLPKVNINQNSFTKKDPLSINMLRSEKTVQSFGGICICSKLNDMLIKLRLGQMITGLFNKIPIFLPQSRFKICWDILYLFVILSYLFLIPIHISFDIPFYQIIGQLPSDIMPYFIILDQLVNYNTGFYQKGVIILSRWKIIKAYLRNNCITDILAIIPSLIYHFALASTVLADEDYKQSNIIISTNPRQIGKIFLLFFYLKLNCFNQIIKKLEERSNLSKYQSNLLQFIKLLFTIIIIAHIFANLWIFVAKVEQQLGYESWLNALNIQQSDWLTQYVRAYYFSVVTMITVGYGDVLPKTNMEMLLSIISIMISCGVYAYLLNEVGQLFNEFQKNKKMMKNKMQVINYYMHKKGVNNQLQCQVRDYLEYFWREQLDRDQESEQKIINLLSDQLKQQLLIEANKIVLKDSPIFANNFSDRIIQKTISLIHEYRFTPEEIIVQEGVQFSNAIYFIEKGSVEVIIPGRGQKEMPFPIQILEKGQSFSADTFFTGGISQFTVRSREFTTLLMIKRSDFLNILKDFPDDYEVFCAIKDNIQMYSNYEQIGYFCQSCLTQRHLVHECPFVHFMPKKQLILKIYNQSAINEFREKYNRQNNTVKKNSLSLKKQIVKMHREFHEENEEEIFFYIKHFNLSTEKNHEKVDNENEDGKQKSEGSSSDSDSDSKSESENSPKNKKLLPEQQQSKDNAVLVEEKQEGKLKNVMLAKKKSIKFIQQMKQDLEHNLIAHFNLSSSEEEGKVSKRTQEKLPLMKTLTSNSIASPLNSSQQQQSSSPTPQQLNIGSNTSQDGAICMKKTLSNNSLSTICTQQEKVPVISLPTSAQATTPAGVVSANPKKKNLFVQVANKINQFQQFDKQRIRLRNKQSTYPYFQRYNEQKSSLGKLIQKLQSIKGKIDNQGSLDQQIPFLSQFQHQNDQVDYIFQNFETQKNFSIYFPYNNLSYYLQVRTFQQEERNFFIRRIFLDNMLYFRKLLLQQKKQQHDITQATMNQVLQKFKKQQMENEESKRQEERKSCYLRKKETSVTYYNQNNQDQTNRKLVKGSPNCLTVIHQQGSLQIEHSKKIDRIDQLQQQQKTQSKFSMQHNKKGKTSALDDNIPSERNQIDIKSICKTNKKSDTDQQFGTNNNNDQNNSIIFRPNNTLQCLQQKDMSDLEIWDEIKQIDQDQFEN